MLDREHRPLMGLTPSDFTLLEDGIRQPIAVFREVRGRDSTTTVGSMRDVVPDVTAPNGERSDLLVLVLDDALTAPGAGWAPTTQSIARAVINDLDPEDQAGIVFTSSHRGQDLTSNRQQLLQAVDSFKPAGTATTSEFLLPWNCPEGSCVRDTLTAVIQALGTTQNTRKTVVFVGFCPALSFPSLADTFKDAQRANVSIYAVDPRGLDAGSGIVPKLAALAEGTGGRVIGDRNDVAEAAARAIRDSRSYYMLGFRPSAVGATGRFHRLSVKVSRRGVDVRSRAGYYAAAGPNTESRRRDMTSPLERLSPPPPFQPQAGATEPIGPLDDALSSLLRRAAEYVAGYERELPAIVAEEDYTQRFIVEPMTEVRRLRSDLLTVRDEVEGWTGFRDVFEIDGRPVRDRTDRLANLFLNPHADARLQAQRIAEESARFNLAEVVPRTINTPLLALQFVRTENQVRSKFTDGGRKNIRGVETRILVFQERTTPRIIRTPDGSAARGRIWVDPATGRIIETELFIDTARRRRFVNALIHVVYAEQPRLRLWLPVSMDETYHGVGVITGHATYSNFRRFNVFTDTVIKAP